MIIFKYYLSLIFKYLENNFNIADIVYIILEDKRKMPKKSYKNLYLLSNLLCNKIAKLSNFLGE
ncbi:Uncharacterised protein [uncultured archaeon]|nr:Uncharacterised protein [uncultured archaeon]